ncbi:hypothetical protein BX589_117148 [Paraburkholderia fungorum]|jgi:hypothetical protein|nr:hypothetical protein BX589_117148 [Paraburkholderia fungorum]
MAHRLKSRNHPSSTGTPNDVQENLSDDVKDRLRHAQIVQLEGEVAELECTQFTVTTDWNGNSSNHGTMRSFRFQVNGVFVVLYTPKDCIPYYSKIELPLAEGDRIRLAIASEALSGRHLVYGFRNPVDRRVFVAFATGSLDGTMPDSQIYYLPRLPRFWGKSRWKQASMFGAFAMLAFALFAYLGHGESSEDGLSATVVFNSMFGIAYASYLLTITYGALRWRLNFPTQRQRNLLAVLRVLEVPAQGPNKGTICAI